MKKIKNKTKSNYFETSVRNSYNTNNVLKRESTNAYQKFGKQAQTSMKINQSSFVGRVKHNSQYGIRTSVPTQ